MDNQNPNRMNLDDVRAKLAGKSGREYWRSLEQVAETPEFQAWVEDEFPNRRSIADIDRRSFLKFMGASMALAGLGGCRSLVLPTEQVMPYVKLPEDMVPGNAMQFATAYAFNGNAIGLVVESHEGRPTKIEGNKNHPWSLGSTDHFAQAELLNLYDPDRMQGVLHGDLVSSFEIFLKQARLELDNFKATGGTGLWILATELRSPTVARLLTKFKAAFPNANIAIDDPAGLTNLQEGTKIAFGQPAEAIYSLDKASVVVSLDSDFLYEMPGSIRMSRDFMSRRSIVGTNVEKMNRLYAVESSPTTTGAMADHRLTVDPRRVEIFTRQLASALGVSVMDAPTDAAVPDKWVKAVAKDLESANGEGVVIPGQFASPATIALAVAINKKLASKAVRYVPAKYPVTGLDPVLQANKAGAVKGLIILGGNPVFTAPADARMDDVVKKVPFTVHHTLYSNETSKLCRWTIAASHFLESWGDVEAIDGTVSITQPLINTIKESKSEVEFLASLMSDARTGYQVVQETYGVKAGNLGEWNGWLNEGVVRLGDVNADLSPEATLNVGPAPAPLKFSAMFRPDPTVWDGRYANNGWLQELPKVLTTLTWDNAALISPATAQKLGVATNDWVEITSGANKVKIQALVMVGHPDEAVTLHLGYGRTVVGTVGANAGVDVSPLRSSASPWLANNVQIAKTDSQTGLGDEGALALTQTHHSMEGRDILKAATVAEFLKDPRLMTTGDEEFEKGEKEGVDMWPSYKDEFPTDLPQWGLSIDLNMCTGCHACVAACVAENNIPVVGKVQVVRGREMHWIRIDRYYRVKGHSADEQGALSRNVDITNARDIMDPGDGFRDILDGNNIETVFAPVACMHCEKAPCEPVCPVAATVHSHEGLNQMIYNRCVGTRYCSNNCPYKVRRFNYLNYTDNQAQFMVRNSRNSERTFNSVISTEKVEGRQYLKLLSNPSVTVRGRGVMEKCTYCVQRINEVRIDSKKAGRPIKDGEIVTACQQACPTQAITFGNIADKNSAVSKAKADPRTYSMLPELNTRNRTTYMARLRNVNPELENA